MNSPATKLKETIFAPQNRPLKAIECAKFIGRGLEKIGKQGKNKN